MQSTKGGGKKDRQDWRSHRIGAGLLLGGSGPSGGVRIFLGEALDAAGGVNQLLLAGEEGVTIRANFNIQPVALDGRTSREIVAAGAMHGYGVIVGVNAGFHEAPFLASGLHGSLARPEDFSRVARSPGYS